MAKQNGTFLQSAKIDKVKLRAQRSKISYKQSRQKDRPRRLCRLNAWEEARTIAYLARDAALRPSEANAMRQKFADFVEDLNDHAEALHNRQDLASELREPVFEYRAVVSACGEVTALTAVNLAMAAIVFLMVLEKHFSDNNSAR